MRPHLHLVTDTPPAPSVDARGLLVSALKRAGLRHLLEFARDAAREAAEHPDADAAQCLSIHAAGDLLDEALGDLGPRRVG